MKPQYSCVRFSLRFCLPGMVITVLCPLGTSCTLKHQHTLLEEGELCRWRYYKMQQGILWLSVNVQYPLLTTPNYFNKTNEYLVSHSAGKVSRFSRRTLNKLRLFWKNRALATAVIIPQFKLCQQNLVPALSCWRQQGVGIQTQASMGRDFTVGSAPKLSLSPVRHLCHSTQGGTYTPCHMPVWNSSLCLGLSAKHQETAGNLPTLFLRKRQPFLEMF